MKSIIPFVIISLFLVKTHSFASDRNQSASSLRQNENVLAHVIQMMMLGMARPRCWQFVKVYLPFWHHSQALTALSSHTSSLVSQAVRGQLLSTAKSWGDIELAYLGSWAHNWDNHSGIEISRGVYDWSGKEDWDTNQNISWNTHSVGLSSALRREGSVGTHGPPWLSFPSSSSSSTHLNMERNHRLCIFQRRWVFLNGSWLLEMNNLFQH